uniref:Secreted protein n=1 Tax=Anopheles merus TaxID=30066 RepID=A0A182V8T1_ANOME
MSQALLRLFLLLTSLFCLRLSFCLSVKMQLLQRKKTDPSFVISIESGVEEVREPKVHEECDFLVDVLTGKRSVSPDFCCKMLYMIFCTCFTSDGGASQRPKLAAASVAAAAPQTSNTQRPLTYQTI